MGRKTYFGIMRVCDYVRNGIIDDEWFVHFSFESSYDTGPGGDLSEHCEDYWEDYWEAFWNLKSVSYNALWNNGYYRIPCEWNYIRELNEVNTDGLHMGKWIKKSPFHRDGRWQRDRS